MGPVLCLGTCLESRSSRESGVGRRETGERRRETGVGSRESVVGRRESGVGRRESGVGKLESSPCHPACAAKMRGACRRMRKQEFLSVEMGFWAGEEVGIKKCRKSGKNFWIKKLTRLSLPSQKSLNRFAHNKLSYRQPERVKRGRVGRIGSSVG